MNLQSRPGHRPAWPALAGACALAAIGLFASAGARPIDFRLDPEHTRVHWELVHFGTSTLRGRFDRLAGAVTLDRTRGRGEVSIIIDTASVSSGFAPFDAVLRGPELLASDDHPQAYFVARQLRFEDDRLVSLNGEITLRGISRPFELHALRFRCLPARPDTRERCGGDFEGTLKRSDFGMNLGLPWVADTVRLRIQVEATAP